MNVMPVPLSSEEFCGWSLEKNTHHLSSDAAAFGRDDIYPEQLCKLCSLFTYI
jgi:hypothetical protein